MSSQLASWKSNPSETHGPLLCYILWPMLLVCGLFMVLRLHIRLSHRRLWWDDAILIASWCCLLAQVLLMQLSVDLGFGKHILDINTANLDRITYYGATALSISIAAINLSKLSFAVTLIPLTYGIYRAFIWFVIATLALFAIPIAILPWVQCRPLAKTFVDFYPGECMDKSISVKIGMVQAGWGALMDVCLALLPWKVLWGLQMRRIEKIGVALAMSLGLFSGAAALMRSRYIFQLSQQDISYDALDSTVWSVCDTTVTIIATCIPVLRKFITDKLLSLKIYLPTPYGSSGKSRRTGQSHAADATGPGNLRMLTINHEALRETLNLRGQWHAVDEEMWDGESGKSILGGDQVQCPEPSFQTPKLQV